MQLNYKEYGINEKIRIKQSNTFNQAITDFEVSTNRIFMIVCENTCYRKAMPGCCSQLFRCLNFNYIRASNETKFFFHSFPPSVSGKAGELLSTLSQTVALQLQTDMQFNTYKQEISHI